MDLSPPQSPGTFLAVLRVDFVSLFPEMILGALRHSIMLRAENNGHAKFRTVNPRDFCYERHLKVDDVPYGGEPGMLIKAEPVYQAVESLREAGNVAVIMTSPTGVPFQQHHAQELSGFEQIIFLCGHYEGIDHRVEEAICTHSFSIGDFILTNGEMPAVIMADATVRVLPGVLGSAGSLAADSHSDGLLSAPNFTRPEVWRGRAIPEVLKSGNHKLIGEWRRTQSLRLTALRRPDLLARAPLDRKDVDVLES